MDDDPDSDCEGDIPASPSGILQCLRLLAEEAELVNMTLTVKAIRRVLRICEREAAFGENFPGSGTVH